MTKNTRTRDYVTYINNAQFNGFLKLASEANLPFEFSHGALVDNALIYNDYQLSFKGIKPREYIMMIEEYENTWNSKIKLIMTDNNELADFYLNAYFMEDEDND